MANILCKKNGHNVHIIISGNATMSFTFKTRDFMKSIVDGESTECHIDLSRISEIDIAYLQLLASFRLTMERYGKKVHFDTVPNNHPFTKFITQVGLRKDYFFRESVSYAV
ncbi:MAG TPA: STAS domain-containing protein [Spirochaetota bacterium]|nr:STAS domain-containing protein [Spirochaetota bacterium]